MNTRSTNAKHYTRRRFLRGMGLSAASAPLVLGMGDLLIQRALGQENVRKMALFIVHGETWNGGNWETSYTPPGVNGLNWQGNNENRTPRDGQDDQFFNMEVPPFFDKLRDWKDRSVLVDGLPLYGAKLNNPSATHGLGYTALSSIGQARTPSGTSIDQRVAQIIGNDRPIKSLLFGFGGKGNGNESKGTFAMNGAGIAHAQNPSVLLSQLTGKAPSSPDFMDLVFGNDLFDLVKQDLTRLERGLASEEKALLDEHLASMQAFKDKQDSLATLGSCSDYPTNQLGGVPKGVAVMDLMFRISTIALQCGVTNVVGASIANTGAHNDLDLFVNNYSSHGAYDRAMKELAPRSMGWVDTMLKDLGPLANDMTVTIVPGNGLGHKGQKEHHGGPIAAAYVIDGTDRLLTGSRFLRRKRHLADFYTTMTHAFGKSVQGEGFSDGKFNNAGDGLIDDLLV